MLSRTSRTSGFATGGMSMMLWTTYVPYQKIKIALSRSYPEAHGLIKTYIVPEQVANQAMNLRSTSNTLVTYKILKVRTLCHQNSYMVRVPRICNSLPDELRNLVFPSRLSNLLYLDIIFLQH